MEIKLTGTQALLRCINWLRWVLKIVFIPFILITGLVRCLAKSFSLPGVENQGKRILLTRQFCNEKLHLEGAAGIVYGFKIVSEVEISSVVKSLI